MRLTSLNPRWLGAGGPGIFNADGSPATPRHGIALMFDCPCATCVAQRTGNRDDDYQLTHHLYLNPPLDGGPVWTSSPDSPVWTRQGDTFDTLVLRPSILSAPAKGGCGWHGYIGGPAGDKPGEVVAC